MNHDHKDHGQGFSVPLVQRLRNRNSAQLEQMEPEVSDKRSTGFHAKIHANNAGRDQAKSWRSPGAATTSEQS